VDIKSSGADHTITLRELELGPQKFLGQDSRALVLAPANNLLTSNAFRITLVAGQTRSVTFKTISPLAPRTTASGPSIQLPAMTSHECRG
jgi:hypothetical protein